MLKRIIIVAIIFALTLSLIPNVSAQQATDGALDMKQCIADYYKKQGITYADFQNFEILFYNPCDDTCEASTDIVNTLKGGDNREKVFNYLRAKGLSPEQAAGVTGNIQSESGFSPTRQEISQTFPEGGWGLVQWTFGRRSDTNPEVGVVAYLNSKIPEVMSTYYSNEYGGSVTEPNGFVPSGMPVDANDKLLLNELDFLYKESTKRTVRQATIAHVDGATAGDGEWDTLKKQTTVEKASNLWVYNFEIPGNIDATARSRATNGQTILDKYSSSADASVSECDGLTGTIREKVVQAAEKEYAAWQSGQKTKGSSFLEYTYGVDGEWCAWFASWIYKEAGYPVNDKPQPYYSFVSEMMALGQKNEKFEWHLNDGTYTPQPGDIAIYGDATSQYHTNLVISASSPTVTTTIGGNEGPVSATPATREVKKTENGTYWASEAYGYVSPKG